MGVGSARFSVFCTRKHANACTTERLAKREETSVVWRVPRCRLLSCLSPHWSPDALL